MQIIGVGVGISTKLLGILNPPWKGFEKKTYKTIEVHAGMANPMMRDVAIEEALQEEKKDTLEHNNQSYDKGCAQIDKLKNSTSFSWPYMIVSML